MKYFIFWKDYDNDKMEEFEENEFDEMEKRLTELEYKFEKENYGGFIQAVIAGKKLEYEVVERVKEIKIKGE